MVTITCGYVMPYSSDWYLCSCDYIPVLVFNNTFDAAMHLERTRAPQHTNNKEGNI